CTCDLPWLLPGLEDLDRVALGEGDDGALLVGAFALRVAAALDLSTTHQRVDGEDLDVPDLLDRLLDLRLVGAIVDEERVRVALQPRVGLFGDDGADDDVAGRLHEASSVLAGPAASACSAGL